MGVAPGAIAIVGDRVTMYIVGKIFMSVYLVNVTARSTAKIPKQPRKSDRSIRMQIRSELTNIMKADREHVMFDQIVNARNCLDFETFFLLARINVPHSDRSGKARQNSKYKSSEVVHNAKMGYRVRDVLVIRATNELVST